MGTYHAVDRGWTFESRRAVPQRTLRSPIRCRGVGLHSGQPVSMLMRPAGPDQGITFVRTDVRGRPTIPARWDRVADTRLCTVVANDDGISVSTIEHLMAAFAGVGVDNVIVEVDGPELPIMDGSAEPFVFLLHCVGLVAQASPRRALKIIAPVSVDGNGWSVSMSPGAGFSLDVEIDFPSAVIANQSIDLGFGEGTFERELARARTFGFLEEVERLRAAGLARGGSLDNVVVVTGDGVMNEDGLRFGDEFVRHKALDAVGDLYLVGAPIIGHFQGLCSGHAANNRLLRALFADSAAWEWETLRVGDGRDAGRSARGPLALAAAGSA
jgi:UDP-3-O-[3-hydroxymyristoyl] N-acetylglucosamine deacetylase